MQQIKWNFIGCKHKGDGGLVKCVEHEIHIEMKAQNWHIPSLSKNMMVSILCAYNFLTKHLRETCIK